MPKDRVETAQLQREIVGVAVHDLGSVAAALVMRAALPPATALAHAERQQVAMGSLAAQLRASMQLLDVARISPSALHGEPLAGTEPGTAAALEIWLQRWPTLARSVLPRGARLQVSAAEPLQQSLQHPPNQAPQQQQPQQAFLVGLMVDALATQVLMSGLHVVQAPGHVTLHVALHVALQDTEEYPARLQCILQTASRTRGSRARVSRWQRYAEHVLGSVVWPFQWWEEDADGNSSLRLTIPLSRAQPKESA